MSDRNIHNTMLGHRVHCLMLVAIGFLGCSDPNAGVVTDMHKDFEHDHKHQHSEHNDHEHDHADGFNGSHSHEHTHGHRHDDPLFGGRLFSIGHTHHDKGATHFHAEVMPLEDNSIRFHVLTDSADGGLEACPVKAQELAALISVKGKESLSSECTFTAVDDRQPASEFSLVIPEAIAGEDVYSVVVPKIEVGGHRQNFSFRIRRVNNEQEPAAPTNESEDLHE